ncbi:NADPH dehydrogenase [Xenorhabdus mauleonii]|uniref:Gentisate 1,2-dioxygenase n=1 Tax=Xenorhabdus mauleonii TaxID=351675 RepID=A0A1I3KF21_9GAMM|nr:cupin domain-containing protein [Xenorhabdus mauleonii]PHM45026.1 NADPH dehydrogenase [Xenorhabdus mauleonii]SFI70888.1 gentisate 1,2-dioxygenase [Xenorhabdus mauleonii]
MSQEEKYLAHDLYKEDILGRANVSDSPELLAYYQELEKYKTGALWTIANKIEPWQPQSASVPVLWRYSDLREHVIKSADLVTPEQAGRRVVYLNNSGGKGMSTAVGLLYSGLQTMQPGESASAHAHSSSALRFIMEGRGAYTIVDGQKMLLEENDFVLTPNGTWHEHGVEPDGSQCIWQDGLDIPLVNTLEASFYKVHPELRQAVTEPVNSSIALWGAPALRPQNVGWDKPYSPLFRYQWGPTYEALQRYASIAEGSPFDDILMHYTNPLTGGHVMPTLGASMQLLRPGFVGKAHRHTGSFIYQVAKGQGYSIINGQRFDWQKRDIFCVPSWAFHEHVNTSQTEDACLFCFNDLPVIQALQLYYEEALHDNGGHQQVGG